MHFIKWPRLVSPPGGKWPGSGRGHACTGVTQRSRQHSVDGAVNTTLSTDACTAWLARLSALQARHSVSRGRSRAPARRSTGCAEPVMVLMRMCPHRVSTLASRRSTHPSLPRAYMNAGGCTVSSRAPIQFHMQLRDGTYLACVFLNVTLCVVCVHWMPHAVMLRP